MWELLLLSTINVSSFNSFPFYPRNEFFELVRQGTTILHVTGSFIAIQSHNPGPRLPRIKKSLLSSWNPISHILKKEIFVLLLLAFCTVLVELYFKTVIGQTFLEFPLKLPLRNCLRWDFFAAPVLEFKACTTAFHTERFSNLKRSALKASTYSNTKWARQGVRRSGSLCNNFKHRRDHESEREVGGGRS